MEEIIAKLKSKEKDVRDAAIDKLAQMDAAILASAGKLVVEPLVAAARWGHKYNDEASRAAVKVLVKMGNPAVQPLLELTKSDNYISAQIACIALARIGDSPHAQNARAKLGAYVEEPDEYKASNAIDAMVEIGDEFVVDSLIFWLKTHPNEHIRSRSAWALGMIGDKRAIPALTEALQDPSRMNVLPVARWALGKLKQ
jgi:HEAT repeat protein